MSRILPFLALASLAGAALGPDFSALLAKPADDIKKPKPLPEGSYNFLCTKYEFREANTPNDRENPKKPVCSLSLRYQEALDDVDAEDLAAALGDDALTTKVTSFDLWLTNDAQWRVVQLCRTAGIATEGRSLGEVIPELVNKVFTGAVAKVQSKKNPNEFFSNVNSLIGVDNPDAANE